MPATNKASRQPRLALTYNNNMATIPFKLWFFITHNSCAITRIALLIFISIITKTAHAEWSAKLGNTAYFTDDVALFSVTRRLSLKDDPTQPIVDRPSQGSDFVYEPAAALEWSGHNPLGELEVSLDAAGYIFANQSAYSHGLFEVQIAQHFSTGTVLHLDYNLVPDLFLGKNDYIRPNGRVTEHDEKLTNHFWSFHIDQAITDSLTFRLLGRYGLRNYNAPFQHRDTEFWTLGPHLEWIINPDMQLLVGYHYEQGLAKPEKALHFPDDVSYVNHYASAELKIRLLEKLSAVFIFDYEKNNFTTANNRDEHYGLSENVYQGEIELLYELTESAIVKLGWQHGRRKLNSEEQTVNNNNLWLGLDYDF